MVRSERLCSWPDAESSGSLFLGLVCRSALASLRARLYNRPQDPAVVPADKIFQITHSRYRSTYSIRKDSR